MEDYRGSYTDAIEQDPHLSGLPYDRMAAAAWDTGIYYGNSWPVALEAIGWSATQVVPRCRPLQFAWAKANGMRTPPRQVDRRPLRWAWTRRGRALPGDSALRTIVDRQVRHYRPDVLWVFSGVPVTRADIDRWRQHVGKVVLWWSCALIEDFPYDAFDIILTGFPPWVEEFRARGIHAAYLPHAFDPRMTTLETADWELRAPVAAFVGNLSPAHLERIAFLDALSRRVDVDFYGTGLEHLPPDSPLRARHRGPAWGRALYSVYGSHALVVEVSGDMPGRWSFSKRLFEATGMGACLVTEESQNLSDLFLPGIEVVPYDDLDACIDHVRELTSGGSVAREIALAGQQRTLREHSYQARAIDFAGLVGLVDRRGAGQSTGGHPDS